MLLRHIMDFIYTIPKNSLLSHSHVFYMIQGLHAIIFYYYNSIIIM